MWRHLKGKTLWIGLLAPLLAIGLGAVAYLWDAVPVQLLRNATFDQMQRWHPRPYVEAPVRVVDIDDESLRRLGQWPWPRTRLAELTARLQDAGAAAIVFDVMFAEPDRTSPASMLTLWDAPPPLRQAMVGLPDHDAVFADAIGRGRVVLGFSVTHGRVADTTEQAASTEATTQAPRNEARFIALGEPPASYLHDFSEGVDSLPALATAAAGNGALTFIPDADGVVRKVPLLMRRQGVVVPSLVTEALRVAQGARNITTRTSPEKGVGLEEVRIGAASIRTTPQGEAWVHYSRASPQRTLPVWKVMAGQVPATELKDRILLVGASAQGLLDLRFSPLTGIIPGVEVHAQFLEQALTGGGLDRPSWAPAVEASVLVFGGLVVTGIALSTGALLSFAVFAALLALWAGVAWRAFAAHGLLIDAATPALSLALTFALASIVRHLSTEGRQRWVKRAFSRYVSPNLVQYLVAHPKALELGGRRQDCSFVFTDLAGFTSLMERMDAGEAVALLNDYLDGMIAIAFEHQGTLDRIVGDAVAIMFSAPVPQADHQRRALACGLAMQRFASRYLLDVKARGGLFCATRIGIHSGEVIVGNFGGSHMFDYRALGDAVNTASRLEGANKHLGTLVCVSQDTLQGCADAPARPIGRLLLKGKSVPLMVFEPLETPATNDGYVRAYELMREQHPEALAAFEALAAEGCVDPLVSLHLARLRAGQTGDLVVLEEK